jgi:hypothetical protein
MIKCEICGHNVPNKNICNATMSISDTVTSLCYDLQAGGFNVCCDCLPALKIRIERIIFDLKTAKADEMYYKRMNREDE